MKNLFIILTILLVHQIVNAIDINNLDPNLYLQKIRELEQTIKTQQQEIDQLTAIIENAKKEFEKLKVEAARLKEENAKLQEQIGGSASFIPFTGEETPLTMVEAYPEKYIGKTFIAIGSIGVRDYYIYKYEYAKKTHISLRFDEVRQNVSQTGVGMHLYVRREISKNLVEEITKTINTGYSGKLIRVKVSILENRYSPEDTMMAELIDWQVLSSDKKSWQDWAINEETVKPRVETSYNFPKDGIVYRSRRRNQEWFNKMYERFHDKIVYVDGKYRDIQEEILNGSSITYQPLTKEQFAEAINSGFILFNYTKIGEKINKQPVP
jgi:uncharacterized coiled-coil protein SlyX